MTAERRWTRWEQFSTATGLLAIGVGLLVLAGWVADAEGVKSLFPDRATMKVNTAFSFVLLGLAVALTACSGRDRSGWRFVRSAGPVVVAVVTGLTLTEFAFAMNLGIDELIFRDTHTAAEQFPGRMASITAALLLLLATALLLPHTGRASLLVQGLACLALLVSLLCCLSYLYAPDSRRPVAPFSAVAVHTAVTCALLSLGVLASLPRVGLVGLFANEGIGGGVVRRLLPAAIAIPILMGWLRLAGQRAGWYGTEFGLALFALSNVTVFVALVFWVARWTVRVDAERSSAERSLRDSEERYRVLAEVLPHMVWTMRPDLTLEFLNRNAAEFTGSTVEQANREGWQHLVHPDDLPGMMATVSGPLARGEPYEAEYRFRHHTGEYRWVQSRAVPLKDASGAVVQWVGSTLDLHDRRTAEDRLRASERRYRMLLEGVPQLIWTCRPDGWCDYLSPQWVEYTGVPEADQLGYGWSEAVHPDDRTALLDRWNRAVQTSRSLDVEFRIRSGSGEYRWFKTRAVLFEADGESKWFGTNTDVHDQRLAEERLRELNADLERRVAERTVALRESEQRFRAIFHSQFQFIGLMRPDGTLVEANRTALAAAGVNEADVLGRPFWDTAWWAHDPVQQARLREAVRRAAAGEQVRFEASHPTPDGAMIWVDFSLTPFCDAGGRVVLLIPEGRDITERKRVEAAFREKSQVLATILDSMGDAVLVADSGGKVLLRNRAFDQMHQQRADPGPLEEWPRRFGVYLPGGTELCPADRLPLVRALQGQATDDEELEIVDPGHPNGLSISVTGRPLVGAEGIAGGVIVIRDISERKRVEADLRANEERYRLATTAAHVGVWEWNVVTNQIHWNDQMFWMYQIPPTPDGVVPYETWSRAVLPEDLPREEAILRQTIECLGSSARSFRIRLPGGVCRHIEAAERVLTDANGRAAWVVGTNLDVTDRHSAEDALRDSEALLRSFFEAPGSLRGVVEVIDGDILHLRDNAASAAFFGRTQDELKNRRASQMGVTAEAIRVWTEHYRECERLGRPVQFEFPVPQTEQWLMASVSALPSTGAAKRFAYVAWDVTDRKRAERALRESEERFRSAFESAPIGMALVGTDGRWLQVNHSLCELVGYDERELLATDFQTVTHPDDLETDLGFVRQMLDGVFSTYQMEKRYLHKTGNVVHTLLSVSLVRDTAGVPLYFIAQIKDITERKQAEQALAANEALLRQFIKHSPAAIAMFDRDMCYLQTSDRWLTDYGLTGRDIIGRPHYEVFPDIPAQWRAIHQRVLAGAIERCDEDPFHRDDGSTVWLQWECQPWRNAAGAIGGLILFTQVITERKLAEEQVKASLREKEVLLKEIHHRVKNNLQIVSALLDLQSGHTDDPQALEMFHESRGRVRSMALIHERLYRSEDMARVNFAEYVEQLVDDLSRTYKLSDRDIRLEVDVDVAPLPIDVAIPCGLLLNELVSNCFKHAFKDASEGCVRVLMTAETNDTNVLVVADDGVGFPAATDFRNTASFGLQLVNTLTEQLGGEIRLDTGRGTTFTVRFPNTRKQ